VAVFSDSTSTMSVRMSVVVMFTLPVLSLVDFKTGLLAALLLASTFGAVPPPAIV